MKQATFYHAGCPVCVSAEVEFAKALNPSEFRVSTVHLGEDSAQISTAERNGVKSVPAMVIDGNVFHINFGASIADLK
ncbi:thioredoxin family protein [Echinimonas agarilytica]|uniref:Thioredoxin family protein n=1 Tax=Echinimonas agarilytica TaxID=1215918 RepID=A0AA41W677_9GAMM|nr:thioredoxin family protein [Echinimonas agarilytica]MCM2679550.1 thioredoxin family protein [Echinimonas agarilytica]